MFCTWNTFSCLFSVGVQIYLCVEPPTRYCIWRKWWDSNPRRMALTTLAGLANQCNRPLCHTSIWGVWPDSNRLYPFGILFHRQKARPLCSSDTIGDHHVDGLLIFQHPRMYPLRDPATDFTSLLYRVLEDQALSNTYYFKTTDQRKRALGFHLVPFAVIPRFLAFT